MSKISSQAFALLWAQITRLDSRRMVELIGMIGQELERRVAPKTVANKVPAPLPYPSVEGGEVDPYDQRPLPLIGIMSDGTTEQQ